MTESRSTRLYSWNTMPMRRRASRNCRPLRRAKSSRRNRISPAVGSTSLLMQRVNVDFPMPEGSMIAVVPRPSTVSETSLRTGWPARGSLRRLWAWRGGSPRAPPAPARARGALGVGRCRLERCRGVHGPRPGRLLLLRCRLLLLLLRQRLSLAFRFGIISRLVVGRAGGLGDLAHHLPCILVGDGNEAVVAVELLAHRRREVEGEETAADLLGEIRIKVVRVGEGRG